MLVDKLFSESELAELLALTRAAVAQNRREGVGPKFLRIRRRIRYRGADIEQWLERRTTNPERETNGEDAR